MRQSPNGKSNAVCQNPER